ncbi:unnamed protein product [Acanthoscelides obtectus]|uniref:Uncharacterized protein n=1 Tax=Acanthoscelides obtectus TaxID=200917 RepID=A0A9P0KKC3_ACAOB|nr:unnamed protein product [Acanthoscelides obtectus]CAK1646428.1 hypothetical protein AOBTE_LOCUS14626 [Acanthoscelides obtectus]
MKEQVLLFLFIAANQISENATVAMTIIILTKLQKKRYTKKDNAAHKILYFMLNSDHLIVFIVSLRFAF